MRVMKLLIFFYMQFNSFTVILPQEAAKNNPRKQGKRRGTDGKKRTFFVTGEREV